MTASAQRSRRASLRCIGLAVAIALAVGFSSPYAEGSSSSLSADGEEFRRLPQRVQDLIAKASSSNDPGERVALLTAAWEAVREKPNSREAVRWRLIEAHSADKSAAELVSAVLVDPPIRRSSAGIEVHNQLARFELSMEPPRGDEARTALRCAFQELTWLRNEPGSYRQEWALRRTEVRLISTLADLEARVGNVSRAHEVYKHVALREDNADFRISFAQALEAHDRPGAANQYAEAFIRSEANFSLLNDVVRMDRSIELDSLRARAAAERPMLERRLTLQLRYNATFPAMAYRDAPSVDFPPRGKKATVVYFSSDSCSPCKEEEFFLGGLVKSTAAGLAIVQVHLDPKEGQVDRSFVQLFATAPDALRGQLEIRGFPTTFVLDEEGQLAFRHDGFGPEVGRAISREVDALLTGGVLPALEPFEFSVWLPGL